MGRRGKATCVSRLGVPLPASGSRRAATRAGRDLKTCRQTVMDRDHRVCRSRAADLAFLTRSHGPQRCGLPYVESRCRSRTEEVRGSNPLTSTPQPRRSERRQRRAGGAHCKSRPQRGRERKSQSSREGSQRRGDSALGLPRWPRSVVAASNLSYASDATPDSPD